VTSSQLLDAEALLADVASQVPESLRPNIVIIGSVATAWAFRELLGTAAVATKDIDVLLQPAVDAVATAERLGQSLLDQRWQPRFLQDRFPGTPTTPVELLPALRVSPPDGRAGWFVELLAMPPADQTEHRRWTRFDTTLGHFALPSFRRMPIAVHAAEVSPFRLRIAKPANMALAHLLEHAEPDRTPVSSLPNQPPRFVKDVGRAVSLWWLANERSVLAAREWRDDWRANLVAHHATDTAETMAAARTGLAALANSVRDAHEIARLGVLAPYGTSQDAFSRAYEGLTRLVEEW
jgi:hypothetical protein